MVNLRLLTPFFICSMLALGLMIALACQNSQKKVIQSQIEDYKLTLTMQVNTMPSLTTTLWGFDNVILEPEMIKQNYIQMNVYADQHKEIDSKNSFSRDSLAGYSLSTVNMDKVYSFNRDRHFIKEIPRAEKKNGFLFERNISIIEPFIDDFKISTDTTIDGQTRKLLRLIKDKESIITEYRITMDQSLFQKINIHPISTDLDLKFKGTCMSLEIFSKYKKEENKVGIFCELTHDLSPSDKDLIGYFKKWRMR